MSQQPYIHGTSAREQQRLIAQAAFMAPLLAANLVLQPGERLLEIGCGVGAVLGQIALSHPQTQLSGIDISPEQIARAHRHLDALGLGATSPNPVELVVGDGAALPWPDGHFDRVRLVWVIEHLGDPAAMLREARDRADFAGAKTAAMSIAALRAARSDDAASVRTGVDRKTRREQLYWAELVANLRAWPR